MLILVTGSSGLIGTALQKVAKEIDINNNITWYFSTREDGDLTSLRETELLFSKVSPTHVIHLAAKVDHSSMNCTDNSEFLHINQLINTNVLTTAYKSSSVIKCLSVLSLCMLDLSIPSISIRDIHEGLPKRNNFGYSMSKRKLHCLGNILTSSNLTVLKTLFMTVIPTNIYGSQNGFISDKSGILTFVNESIRSAKAKELPSIWFKGTGSTRIEFMFAVDLARALKRVILYYDMQKPLFISSTKDISFMDLCYLFADIAGFTGEIKFDGGFKEHNILIRNETGYLELDDRRKFKGMFADFIFTPLYVGLGISM